MLDLAHGTPSFYQEYIFDEKSLSFENEKLKEHVFCCMQSLEGWCTPFKAGILMDLIVLIQPETVVEIGVWGGKSLIPMAFALKKQEKGAIYGIDPWSSEASIEGMAGIDREWWRKVDHEGIFQGLVQKINEFGLNDQIRLIRSTSENASPIADIDLLHIDGNHSEKSAFYDVNKWFPLVKKKGIIIFDDTSWTTTALAVEWLDAHCTKLAEYHEKGCNSWGIWIKN